MAQTIKTRVCLRRDTAANWTSSNPVLLAGEMGIETDTRKFKFGDGTTHWNSLSYASIDDHDTTYTLTVGTGTNANKIVLTPSSGSAQAITVPFATNATYAEKVGTSSASYTYTQLVNAFNGKLSTSGGIITGNIGYDGWNDGFGKFRLAGSVHDFLGVYVNQEEYGAGFDLTDGYNYHIYGNTLDISSDGDINFHPGADLKWDGDIIATETWANSQFQPKLPTVTSTLYNKFLHTNTTTGALEWVYVEQGAANWGSISGSINAQTDLMNEFAKYTKTANLATVATSGNYNDLTNKLSAGTNVTIGTDNKINAVDTTYTIGVSGNSVTLTPTGGTAQTITVPYASNAANATNASNANYLGNSTAGWTYSTLNTELQNIRDIAGGKTATYITNKTRESDFNSQNDTITISKTVINLEGTATVNINDLKVGDIFLLTDTDIPDRWVKSKTTSSVTFGKMETSKIDLTSYVNALSGTAGSGVVTNITKSGQVITVTSKSLATSDPTASGNATSYIDSISQAADGKITATKKTIPTATSSVAGITTVGASGGAAAYSHTHSVLTFTDAGGTSKTYNGGSTQTINYVSTSDNTVIWDCGGANQ